MMIGNQQRWRLALRISVNKDGEGANFHLSIS